MRNTPLLISMALRNLSRQKRRNLLLGVAMAFGMAVLVLANSFSHGISDTLFNKIIVYVAGHIEVDIMENGRFRNPIMRDKPRIESIIRQNVKSLIRTEDTLQLMCRAIGNGKSDFLVVVGVKMDHKSKDTLNFFPLVQGKYADYTNPRFTNPIMITESKARALGVKLFDKIHIRFGNIHGQQQTAVLTVVGILKQKNAYMDMAVYLNKASIKELVGLMQQESGALQIIIKNPKQQASKEADNLHKALVPKVAIIKGTLGAKGKESVWVMAFRRHPQDMKRLQEYLPVSGNISKVFGKEGVLVPEALAKAHHLKIGSPFIVQYHQKFSSEVVSLNYSVKGIYPESINLPGSVILVADQLFYRTYYGSLPVEVPVSDPIWQAIKRSNLSLTIGREWDLMPRSKSTKEFMKRMKDLMNEKSNIAYVDVRTMYETASAIVKMESVLNLLTLFAVLVLFFIILIGVVNTLRMTIRERTREIGTMRSIGMQSRDVRAVFMYETFFLSLFATCGGVITGFGLMGLLGKLSFNIEGALSILLVDQHLHFVPLWPAILGNMVLIIVIAQVTAFFPARRASRLSAAQALRHYE